MIRSCFVSPNSNAREPSEYRLLENLCPHDDTLQFYPATEDRQRFSFTFWSRFNVSLLFLHCEIASRPARAVMPSTWRPSYL
ncbi:hypothetical protein CRUP_003894 [Coryphaenoides rupestris]|nr:hypothetical protein CRUP_003894 [Coryphaenoides rupestris]